MQATSKTSEPIIAKRLPLVSAATDSKSVRVRAFKHTVTINLKVVEIRFIGIESRALPTQRT
jgi:hypothetical protein